VDRKDGTVRVLDYKTGRDETEIGSFENLFNPNINTKNSAGRKAGFQTFYYAWLYGSKYGLSDTITPGLINIKRFFQEHFDARLKQEERPIEDARIFLPQFEEKLGKLLQEIFSKSQVFDQTEDLKKCTFCDYKGICGR